jgi:hypothetical protein|tara:strand:- start:532 stop:690 length:159 start_codon:yes stop_codon:yes gene_type:complete
MNNNVVKKYEEYKKAKESGVSNKERYKLLANVKFANPSDADEFLSLLKRKKD